MLTPILRTFDLHPDGVQIIVNWDGMSVGTSVFVPCINTHLAEVQVKKITSGKGWSIKCEPRIEGEHLGIRVWRTL